MSSEGVARALRSNVADDGFHIITRGGVDFYEENLVYCRCLPKEDRPAGWRKGPPNGGEIPAIFVIQSRLSQVADLACTMKRIARRLEETGMLTKPESYFFGGEKNFRKNWIKSLLKNEWL